MNKLLEWIVSLFDSPKEWYGVSQLDRYNIGKKLLQINKKRRKKVKLLKGEVGKLFGVRIVNPNNELFLVLERKWYTKKSTIGELSIDGKFECYILEDYDRLSKARKKVYGETAIPRGTYTIRLNKSPRFKRILPLLISVPGFSGIRIHAGNTAKDTEGCLLPGTTRRKDFVGQSKRAFSKLYKKLERAKSENRKIIMEIQ
jgi:hypothetical protein